MKTTSLVPFLTRCWISPFYRRDHFLQASWPPLWLSKRKLVFPPNKFLLLLLICLWAVLYPCFTLRMFWSTSFCHFFTLTWGSEYTTGCTASSLIRGWCVMAIQPYCYLRQSFIIVQLQMSISKWHQLTNCSKSPRIIWHCAGSDRGLLLISAIPKLLDNLSQ